MKPGKEKFKKAHTELIPKGMRLSPSYSCALGISYLAEGEIKMSSELLIVQNDETNALENSLYISRSG
jgi:hypothetical protein